MDKKKNSYGINKSLLVAIFVPLLIVSFFVISFISRGISDIVQREVKEELKNAAFTVSYTFDMAYPGDYDIIGSKEVAVVKGEKVLNNEFEIIDRINEETGYEISVFYQNTRIITTIRDDEGERIIGSTIRKSVLDEVLKDDKGKFYDNIEVDGEKYFSYYLPIKNNAERVGMIAILKPVKPVEKKVLLEIIPVAFIAVAGLVVVGLISYRYSKNLILRINKINQFLVRTSNGNFKDNIHYSVYHRNDEISEMGRTAENMQHSLRNLVELDSLTEINNRRYGDKYLLDIQSKSKESGVPYSIAILDIDFFKKINDTYGHLCGDIVLKEIALILKEGMHGKGFACRWGGEEFLLVYDRDKKDDAYEYLKAIVEKIKRKEIAYNGDKISVTVTCGITEGDDRPIHMIVKEADNKLYKGKKDGRDRIVK